MMTPDGEDYSFLSFMTMLKMLHGVPHIHLASVVAP